MRQKGGASCSDMPLLQHALRSAAHATGAQKLCVTLWATLVLLWWGSTHTLQVCRTTGLCDCPGPALQPAPRPEPWCQSYNRKLAREVAEKDAGQGVELLFYGDSITETWRGTDMGRQCSRCAGVPDVFYKHFGSKHESEVLAVGGDQAAHLMWRLEHGQLYRKHQPRLIVVMIGTNDLGAAACQGGAPAIRRAALGPNGAAARAVGVLRALRANNSEAQILALGVLPRGWDDPWHVYVWPSMYAGGIEAINAALKDFAAADEAVTFLDCGAAVTPGSKILPELMPDALHPNAAGMELLAQCLSPVVDQIMMEDVGRARPRSLWPSSYG